MIWFTSDTHFGHANILKYCNRPFDNIEEHDRALIENWNDRVLPSDTVYHLGDFALCSQEKAIAITKRLNGNVHLILGNHDKGIRGMERHFAWVRHYYELKVKGDPRKVVMLHYGMRVWNASHHGSWQLYGHSHGDLPDHGLSTDVGVDRWDYAPVSWDEIEEYMSKKTKQPGEFDHHGSV